MLTHQLAAATLAHWENDVRRFSPDEHLRWQALLASLPDTLPPAQLRDALAPIAAKNEQEQVRFGELFERALAEVRALNEDVPPPPKRKGFWRENARWLIPVGLLLTLSVAVVFWPEKKPVPAIRKEFAVTTGQTTKIRPEAIPELDSFGSKVASFKIQFGKTLEYSSPLAGTQPGEIFHTAGDSTKSGSSLLARMNVADDTCLAYTARGPLAGTDSLVLRATFANGQECELRLRIYVSRPVAVHTTTPPIAYRFTPHDPPYDHDQRLRDLELPKITPFQTFLLRWAGWLKAGLLLAFLGAVWALIRWQAWKKRRLVAERAKSLRPPYVWNVEIPDLSPPDPGEGFGLTVSDLRRRTSDDTRLLDLPETVRATARRAGMAEFRFRGQTRPPEYLMLVDRHDPRDHFTRLFDDLYRLLRQNEVLVERFFFDGDLRLCLADEHPAGLSLDDLLLRYPRHRLLVVSSGHRLFNPATGRLARWTEQLARWKDRALLTPLPAADWGRRERDLAALFRFAPASLPGLRRLLDAFETTDEAPRLSDLARLAPLALPEPVSLGADDDLAETLEKHFPDPDTRLWLAACALWPELHYDLTLWFGRCLEAETGRPVATFGRLTDLLRLPWFADGEMPDRAAAALLDGLRENHPDLEKRLRAALHALLEQNAPDADTVAFDDFSMHMAFNEWCITTDPARKKELEKRIADWIDRHGNPDFIVASELQGPPRPADKLLPELWKKRLYKGGLPGLGLRDHWHLLFNGLVLLWPLLVAFLVWKPGAPTCSDEQVDVPFGGDTLHCCVVTFEDKGIANEYLLRDRIVRQDSSAFEDFQRAGWFFISSNPESQANVANELYNQGLPDYRAAENELFAGPPGIGPRFQRSKDRACYWFARALRADTSLPWVRAAAGWCTNPAAFASERVRPSRPAAPDNTAPDVPLPEMVFVKGGTFRMGCTEEQGSDCEEDEKPVHEVTLSDIEIGKTEVTVAQYMAFVNETKTHYPEWLERGSVYNINTGTNNLYKNLGPSLQAPNNPIVGISWDDAVAYCAWLSKKTGKKYRLPTEAEWEYAARGGSKTKGYQYAGGDNLDAVGWYSDNSGGRTHAASRKKRNELGLYDMSGNVWEWCSDWYGDYSAEAQRDPQGPASGASRVLRGGGWSGNPADCRAANHDNLRPADRGYAVGFRLALSVR